MAEKRTRTLSNAVLALAVFLGVSLTSPPLLLAGGNTILQPHAYTNQLIVKYRDSSTIQAAAAGDARAKTAAFARLNTLSAAAGVTVSHARFMSGNGHVVKLPRLMTITEATTIAKRLKSDSNVEYAEPDILMFPKRVPDDPYYAYQWHYMSPATAPGGANLPGAWDITTGSSNVVVAVVDTGILPNHPDISGRTVQGYNFISDAIIAGNGVGRSSDPTDLGDWVTAAESADSSSVLYECTVEDSSWHGTHVAGTIGASSNNGIGVAGINWVSKILPVRVLGKCGGYTSDVVDGMRWAAGLDVTGVPTNTNPAKVINLSLGGSGACDTTFQNAINDITTAGTTIVVAGGNEHTDVSNSSPANCSGVISVAAVNRAGARAYYSNYGTGIKIAAPGGEMTVGTEANGILSTLNTGTTTASTYSYQYYQGTSMATPHVSGIVSLMLSLNPNLTPSQVLSILQSTARSFPTGTGSDCTTSTCGSGIIDATAALQAVPPTITTEDITGITTTAATGGGSNISSSSAITAKGICWSTSANPTTSNTRTNNGTGTDSFTASITGLTAHTTYHVRAYATSSTGTAYGADFSFTTAASAILPIVTTTPASSISTTTAASGGNVTSDGGGTVTARGVCWATTANPTMADNSIANGTGTGIFASTISGLTANTTYHVRAYATNAAGTTYGLDQNFTTTPANPPSVTTASVSGITTTSAISGGNVTLGGGSTVSAKGVCWSTSSNPTINDAHTTDGTGTGTFVSSITGLSAGTTYHARAYATNSNGISSYGSDTAFTTLAAATTPTVITTMPIKSITTTSATAGGKVISDGGSSITSRGVCWDTSTNPGIGGNCTSDNSGTGKFTSSLTGLTTNTRYYVRAFAMNAKGISYGSNVTFKTGKRPAKFVLYPPQ